MPAANTDKLRKGFYGAPTTLSASITDGDTTIPISDTTGIPTDTAIDIVIDRVDPNGEETPDKVETLTVVILGNDGTNAIRGVEGTAKPHANGAVVEVLYTAATHNDMVDHLLEEHNQDGSHGDINAESINVSGDVEIDGNLVVGGASSGGGWLPIGTTPTVSSGYNKGNKESELTFPDVDLSSVLSPGMRFKLNRTGTTPTQSLDLESSSSQYANKTSPTGISFTDDFTCEAWVKLESYPATTAPIISRNAADNTNGFRLYVDATGQVILNANARYSSTYQSIPLNQWVHVAATFDMSASTSSIFFNGATIPSVISGSGTSLTATGDLRIGKSSASQYFDGKIADVRIWSAVRTATQIQDNMNQQLVGNESGLVAYFKLNGDFNDSTANANHLTVQNGASATSNDNPMYATEYGVITGVTFSAPNTLVTIFTGTDYNIPNATLSSPSYSTHRAPYGFPADKNKWQVETRFRITQNYIIVALLQWAASNFKLSVPSGAWTLSYEGEFVFNSTVAGARSGYVVFDNNTPTNGVTNYAFTTRIYNLASSQTALTSGGRSNPISLSSPATFTMYGTVDVASGSETWEVHGAQMETIARAQCAYL